jgi:hypothetical protein
MQPLDSYARGGLWLLPVWPDLLFDATFTRQPPNQTDFAGWSRYATSMAFLVSHLVGSVLGAGIGVLGFAALSRLRAGRGEPRLAVWRIVTTALRSILVTAVFGIAAFAQPAIGRSTSPGTPTWSTSATTSGVGRCSARPCRACCY